MKLDVPKAIIIGALIIAASYFLSGMYERQLAFNVCKKIFSAHPNPEYDDAVLIKNVCKFHVYVQNRNNPDLMEALKFDY